ncbi:helix-hairpin-helix domain-containing protein [Streptomyces scopuliridis]|uniref:helix-hairpin-helix domain-containing protein n=1 Tax=Streptomyces scopuliridis TaxID=452529 RepID=UPI0036BD7132
MALRTRSVTSVTSGPGRAPGSDGRARHGRHGRPGGVRTRPRTALSRVGGARGTVPDPITSPPPAPDPPPVRTDARRRAEALFAAAAPGTGGGNGTAPRGADAAVAPEVARAGRRRAWAVSALRERLPLWVQLRCGLEPRTLAALAVVLVVGVILAGHHFWSGRPGTVKAPENVGAEAVIPEAPPETSPLPSPSPSARVVVDVSGKVRRPGVLRLPAGSRVADALHAAGGAKPGADLTGLNRARVLMDGEQVLVGGPAPPGAGVGAGAAGGAPAATAPVSLNAATPEQLDTLPGVGPVLAQHIIDYRGRHGGFRSVDELREVNGIGERRFADLQSLVRP